MPAESAEPTQSVNAAPFTPLPVFDPRQVPVASIDAHLPAIDPGALSPDALRRRFRAPPAWQPELRVEYGYAPREPAPAAVLIPIVQHRSGATVLLTERATRMTTHSGQVAFPGGRVDPGDKDIADAALREAWEEVGLEARFIEPLGNLPTYTTGTSFIVTPVVALVQPGFDLRLNPLEVADAFEAPLAFLMNPAQHRRHRFEFRGRDGRPESREWFSMPWQDGDVERYIWGATAGMLRNLYRFLAA